MDLMSEHLTIGTWNLCLGLPNKKDIVVDILLSNKVKICCLQETEIQSGFPENVLNCGGYSIELEMNSEKKRAGIYVSSDIDYNRRKDLELENMHVVIIDVKTEVQFRIINIYRSFHPPGGISADSFFVNQLSLIRKALCYNCYIVGDFNLDLGMANRPDYSNKLTLEKLENFANAENLTQIVSFDTWSRIIKGSKRSSLLDHMYTGNPATVADVYFETPPFGDHLLVMAKLIFKLPKNEKNCILKRCWSNYDSTGLSLHLTPLLTSLLNVHDLENFTVQETWNCLEDVLVSSIDLFAPLELTTKSFVKKSLLSSKVIKNKINKRKRLLRFNQIHNSTVHFAEIKSLNTEITLHFRSLKNSNVRRAAMGNKGNLWKAVKVARDLNVDSLPKNLTLGGETHCRE